VIPLAHIAGIPIEEAIGSLAPVLAVGLAAFTATLRGRRRRPR
jgi:hypothetical protein